jgi:hypothetical protein
MKFVIASILLLTACGNGFKHQDVIHDSSLIKYVKRFQEISVNITGRFYSDASLSYYFADLGEGKIAGQCTYREDHNNIIKINIKYWGDDTELEREQLMLHELGHCILLRPHRNDEFDDGTPKSIMYWRLMSERVYLQKYDYYIKELFTEN